MTTKDLLKFKSVQYWLEGLAVSTKRGYVKLFVKWLDHTKEKLGIDNPDKLIETRREDLKSDNPQKRKRFEHIAKVWYHRIYEQHEKEGKSTEHAFNHIKTVMSFFSRNDMPLRYKRRELKQPKKKIKRIYIELEDLKTAYTMLDVRGKAVFTTLLQSGLSEIDVCALNIEHIIKDLDKTPVYYEGYREKSNARFQTCLGEDACVAIQKYLILRDNPKEGALFVTKFDKRMTPRSIREVLEPVEKVIPHFKPKMLRDFFHDSLERANIKEKTATRMFGHKLSGAKGEYLLSPYTIKMAYLRAYPHLKINDVTREISQSKSTNELIIKLVEIMGVMATEDKRYAIMAVTNLIDELKGKEPAPETPAGKFREMISKDKTFLTMDATKRSALLKEAFNELVKTARDYLKSV